MPDSNSPGPISHPATYRPGATTYWNSSWRHIYDYFGHAILAYARRRGLNDHSAEDVLQEVMTTLIRCQHGQGAAYNPAGGSFQAWLWGVIRNRVHSVRRKDSKERPFSPIQTRHPDEDTEGRMLDIPQAPPNFARMEEDEWQRAILTAAIARMKQRVTADNFEIYAALLDEAADAEELARRFHKEPNAIYAVKHRCEKMVLAEARVLREAWGNLDRGMQPV